MSEPIAEFIASDPMLKPLGKNAGGGFSLTVEIPESEYDHVKDLNNPALKVFTFRITIVQEE